MTNGDEPLIDPKIDVLVRLHTALYALQEAMNAVKAIAQPEPGRFTITDDPLMTNMRQARTLISQCVRTIGAELRLTDFISFGSDT